MEKNGITYSVLDSGDLEPAARMVGSVFSAEAPFTRHLKVPSDDFTRLVRVFCPKFHAEGLSMTARDQQTREMVGALLNEDMGTKPPPEGKAFSGFERMAPGGALLEDLDRRYFHGRTPEPNKYAHFFFLAVSPGRQGQGIAQRLVELCEDLARRKGYQQGVVEATNLISQHVFRKAGFSVAVEIPSATFEYKGSHPFKGIKSPPTVMLMVKDLAP